MKRLAPEALKKNAGRHPSQTCRYCDDTGYVVWDTGDPHDAEWAKKVRGLTLQQRHEQKLYRANYGEAMVPCPYCERGYHEEFPKTEKRKGEKAGGEASRIASPWGEDGFWASRDVSEIVPAKQTMDYLPIEENARRMRELMLCFHETAVEAQAERSHHPPDETEMQHLLSRPEFITDFEPEVLQEEIEEDAKLELAEVGAEDDDIPF
jgi:hypothetical protein